MGIEAKNQVPGKLLKERKGIILSGSPYSVYAHDAPHVDPAVFSGDVPVLGICYGLQEIALTHGGSVDVHSHKEYGYAKIQVEKTGKGDADRLFQGIEMDEDGGLQVGDTPGWEMGG